MNRPEAGFLASFLVESFYLLNGYRPVGGFGPSRLSFQDVLAYCDLIDYRGEDALWLLSAIQQLDAEWLALSDKKATISAPTPPPQTRKARP